MRVGGVGRVRPASQKIREAAAGLQCQNQLHQMGIACHAHNDLYKILPTGGTIPWDGPFFNSRGYPLNAKDQGTGWAYQILPFIEEEVVHKMKQPWLVPVTIYNCPARRGPPACAWTGWSPGAYCSGPPGNRAWSWHQFWYGQVWSVATWASYTGMIPRAHPAGGPRSLAQVEARDGCANSMMLAE